MSAVISSATPYIPLVLLNSVWVGAVHMIFQVAPKEMMTAIHFR
jgi:hypothetical protein